MKSFITKSSGWAFAIITGVFAFVPEPFFGQKEWLTQEFIAQCKLLSTIDTSNINIAISRLISFFVVWAVTSFLYAVFLKTRTQITIKGHNYYIRVEYGDILKKKKCKRVINFDECFSTQVGNATADINPTSICGQYLILHPNLNMQGLIESAQVSPARSRSKYQHRVRYDSGTIIPNGDDLLMAFAKLDEKGKGRFFSRDEYLKCLDLLWKELENNYSEMDVCVPILGAGTTSFDGGTGTSISQQDLLDMMIWSYKLSSNKIKAPHKLCIVCKRNANFSLNNIEKS